MAMETRYIIQTFVRDRHATMRPGDTFTERSARAAGERARRLYETGRYSGVDAYSITMDADMGDYGDPHFIRRLGEVPDLDPYAS